MTIPVWVEQSNGTFTASALGDSRLKATAESRDEALRRLDELLHICVRRGALVFVDIPEPAIPVPPRQPTLEEIEATREMVAEIYRQRDEEKALEFPG
jgi:hypothetical protein